ncbi:MAG: hypothetical protein RR133_01665 [Kiritimatiellia bacterium]
MKLKLPVVVIVAGVLTSAVSVKASLLISDSLASRLTGRDRQEFADARDAAILALSHEARTTKGTVANTVASIQEMLSRARAAAEMGNIKKGKALLFSAQDLIDQNREAISRLTTYHGGNESFIADSNVAKSLLTQDFLHDRTDERGQRIVGLVTLLDPDCNPKAFEFERLQNERNQKNW